MYTISAMLKVQDDASLVRERNNLIDKVKETLREYFYRPTHENLNKFLRAEHFLQIHNDEIWYRKRLYHDTNCLRQFLV